MLQLLVEAPFRNKTKMHPQNVLDLRRPPGGGAKLWIEITRLLNGQRLDGGQSIYGGQTSGGNSSLAQCGAESMGAWE